MVAAALGTVVEVDTLDGKQQVEIKAGCQSADAVTLRGFGITKLRTNSRGDLIVHVEVVTPQKLSKDEQELLKKFALSRGEKLSTFEVHHRSKHLDGLFGKVRDAFNL